METKEKDGEIGDENYTYGRFAFGFGVTQFPY